MGVCVRRDGRVWRYRWRYDSSCVGRRVAKLVRGARDRAFGESTGCDCGIRAGYWIPLDALSGHFKGENLKGDIHVLLFEKKYMLTTCVVGQSEYVCACWYGGYRLYHSGARHRGSRIRTRLLQPFASFIQRWLFPGHWCYLIRYASDES